MLLHKVYPVSGSIGEVRYVCPRRVALDRVVQVPARVERTLDCHVDIVDDEVERDRRPMALVVACEDVIRSGIDLDDPERLIAQLGLGPVFVMLDDAESKTPSVELHCAIDVVDEMAKPFRTMTNLLDGILKFSTPNGVAAQRPAAIADPVLSG